MKEIPIEVTLELVAALFRDQLDKSGAPMIGHFTRCVAALTAQNKPLHMLTAMALHDVLEDTCLKPGTLLALGYSQRVVDMVLMLTHDKEKQTYEEYIENICLLEDVEIIECKLTDLADNMCEQRAAALLPRSRTWWELRRRDHYAPAQTALQAVLKRLAKAQPCP